VSTYTHRQRLSAPGTVERPLCVAVIGSGPSGFYAAEALLKAPHLTVRVDVVDRLPTPFGLVRGGVAPDHQKIKAVTATYEKVASDPRMRSLAT
jgi:ferredoxin--NADP+ reductase